MAGIIGAGPPPGSAGDRSSIRCVVFDIDDTLYLEHSYVRSGFRAVGQMVEAELGIAEFAERCWSGFVAGVRGQAFDRTLTESGVQATRDLVARMVECYRNHRPAIELLPDARQCISSLRRAGAVIAVITDGPLASQRAKADVLGAAEWSQLTICTELLGPGYGKPHERAFAMVESAFGIHGVQCAYVADNVVKDFIAPKARGWRTIRVRRPAGLHARLESGPEVDIEVGDLATVAEILLGAVQAS